MKAHSLPKNILVVKNRALGDAIIGLSSITYLKTTFANAKVTYLVPRWIFPLFKLVRSDATDLMPLVLKNLSDGISLFFELRKKKFDLVIELHQSGRTGKFFKIFCFLTRTPYFFHNHNLTERAPAIERDLKPCFEAASFFQVAHSKPEFLKFPPRLQILGEQYKKNQIVFGITASRETKRWPVKYFKYLSDMLLKKDPDLEILIPLSESPEDTELEKQFRKLDPSHRVNFLKVPLEQLPAALAHAKLYIGNDTGLKHLSVALGLKSYTFFGPEEPFEWHPYDLNEHKIFFVENLPCRTLKAHYCGLTHCKSMICLNNFVPPKILEELEKNS